MWTSLRLAHQPACTRYQQPSFKKTMQKIHITLLIILSSVFFSAGAIAQNKKLACQSEAVAGLEWKKDQWGPSTRFNLSKFILIQTKDGLTTKSVAKALRTKYLEGVLCRDNGTKTRLSCTDTSGGYLYFDPRSLKGGVSQLLGSKSTDPNFKPAVSLSVFSCTPS